MAIAHCTIPASIIQSDTNGTRFISVETEIGQSLAAYYDAPPTWEYGISPELAKFLASNHLRAEWANPGRLNLYPL
jgi:hypothetical protein